MAKENVTFKIIMISLSLLLLSCKTNFKEKKTTHKSYKIIKIDSISNIYVIYAISEKRYFKIVSNKELNSEVCNTVKVGTNYNFDLKSLFLNKEKLPLMVDGINFHGQSIEIEKDSIMDIHVANNLKGLCISK